MKLQSLLLALVLFLAVLPTASARDAELRYAPGDNTLVPLATLLFHPEAGEKVASFRIHDDLWGERPFISIIACQDLDGDGLCGERNLEPHEDIVEPLAIGCKGTVLKGIDDTVPVKVVLRGPAGRLIGGNGCAGSGEVEAQPTTGVVLAKFCASLPCLH